MKIEKGQKINVAWYEKRGWFGKDKLSKKVVVREILHYGDLSGYDLIILDGEDGIFFRTVLPKQLKELISDFNPRTLATEKLSLDL